MLLEEFRKNGIDYYFVYGGDFDDFNWRLLKPNQLFDLVQDMIYIV